MFQHCVRPRSRPWLPLLFVFVSPGTVAWAQTATNVAPTISGTPVTHAYVGQTYAFLPAAADVDGDALSFSIANKPAWMYFSPTTGKLTGTPRDAQAGRTFSGIRISVSDGKATTALPSFWITVRTASDSTSKTPNAAPVISGQPKTSATVGANYWFKPAATDADGDTLRFSISGKPAWASFSASNGSVWGTPGTANVGTFSNIVISVSDGKTTTPLAPFSITVAASATTNRAPTISGAPVTTARVGQPYAFKPNASDADGDALTYSVSGKPAWATFDTSTGTLYGTPASGDVGLHSNVVIAVSDGKATARLAPFAITVSTGTTQSVTLNWTAPTTNTDGSALTDLAGYVVSYGTASRQYQASVQVAGAGASSVVIDGLTAGTWYFSIRSRNNAGVESDYSGEVSAVL